VPLKICRNGDTKTLDVTVQALPGPEQVANNKTPSSTDTGTLNGVGVADLDQQTRKDLNIPENIKGVVITEVQPDSPSAEAGLKQGDVIQEINRHPVQNADQAVRLTEHPKDKVTLLRIWSNGGSHFVVVDENKSE
jgi:serine protease Do